MPVTFTFDLSQQQFELRCGELVRRLVQAELVALIEDCERCYYSGCAKGCWIDSIFKGNLRGSKGSQSQSLMLYLIFSLL